MFNKVIPMGRLTRDPELRTTVNGISMCRFSVAVDRAFAKQGGVKHYTNSIVGDRVCFCGDKSGSEAQAPTPSAPAPVAAPQRQTAPQAPQQAQTDEWMDMSDFEEILSDGEVPF